MFFFFFSPGFLFFVLCFVCLLLYTVFPCVRLFTIDEGIYVGPTAKTRERLE
jgi:hypothetical protein